MEAVGMEVVMALSRCYKKKCGNSQNSRIESSVLKFPPVSSA
jgi:hypothetical protein